MGLFGSGRKQSGYQKKEITPLIREQDALKIMYYLIASDMSVAEEEVEMFDSIGFDLDPKYESYRNSIINRCNSEIGGITDPDEYYDVIHEKVCEAIHDSQKSYEGDILPSVLLWNLISIAFVENDYSANEKRLIRYVARVLGINMAVVKEMESAMQTTIALEEEEEILKASDRKYSEVEMYMNEIADRKQTIMENMRALMLD